MYDNEYHFTHDAASFKLKESDGITVDDGDASIDWSSVQMVRLDRPPHTQAFDTKQFYVLPATVARPIKQRYGYGEDSVTLKKPREELKRGAWALENAPWTMDHPETGMVKDVSDVRGFFRDPQYYESVDDLDAKLHLPVGDTEAQEFVEENGDVSVGFYNRVARVDSYDGVVGGTDDSSEIDGYQTDILFDHVASVAVGRCSGEEGCGLDAAQHGHITEVQDSFIKGTNITNESDENAMDESLDSPSGIYTADGKWFAVGPDEHPDDSTEYAGDAKFPVNTCTDVKDAWNLRGNGDIDIDESTLESRIKRVAEAKDCPAENRPWTDDADPSTREIVDSGRRYSICGRGTSSLPETLDTETSDDCGCGGDSSPQSDGSVSVPRDNTKLKVDL